MKARYARQTLATHTGRSKEAKWGPTSGAQISQTESFHEVSLRSLEGLTGTILRDVLVGCLFRGAPKRSCALGIGGKECIYLVCDLKTIAAVTGPRPRRSEHASSAPRTDGAKI